MPIVGALLAVLAVFGFSTTFSSGADAVVEPQIQVVVGEQRSEVREPKFIQLRPEPEPVVTQPRVRVTPVIEERALFTPQVVSPTPEPIPTDTPVSVCLGKNVEATCIFQEKEGTCLTIAWSPLTCVPHGP